jgi:uncharacterized protein
MHEYKILFTGTMGAGKTTAIAAVSEVPPVITDVRNSDTTSTKAMTTVGLDFGTLTLDNGDRLRLFGTPGQTRFDFLWQILVRNALGLIILVDNSRPDPLGDMDVYLDGFREELRTLPCVIGIGRLEQSPLPGIDAYSRHLEARGFVLPLLPVDVRKRGDVLLLIDMLLAQIEVQVDGAS